MSNKTTFRPTYSTNSDVMRELALKDSDGKVVTFTYEDEKIAKGTKLIPALTGSFQTKPATGAPMVWSIRLLEGVVIDTELVKNPRCR